MAVDIQFTPSEQAYLARVGKVSMCVDPDWAPFERINEQGQHEGIAADLIQLVAQRTGLKIELLPVRNWDESLAASQAGRCQIMSFLNQSPVRDAWLIFTEPIFYDPNIIVTREEHPYVADPLGLRNHRVALPRGTMVEERIRASYPNLSIITTGSEPEAMSMVSDRRADMTVRSLIVAAYAIKKEGLFNLKIAGQIPAFDNQLRIGVIKSEPVLRDILDKGVRTISAQERQGIANWHVAINVQQGVDYTLVWQVLLASLVVVLIFLYWNRKLSSLNARLELLSVTDKLTGLFNRLKLDELLDTEIRRARRSADPFGVIMLDIDHFKRINDSHGHQVGDQVLVSLVRLLVDNTRQTDWLGRWGGEEFLVICPHTGLEGTRQLAEHLRAACAEHGFPVIGSLTASFGVTAWEADDHPEHLIGRADSALYEAKRQGRNQVRVRTASRDA
ncbi:MAG: diguanylate cyclase [Rhodocyclales bacterium GT-UBC]|nr:MAG: diguanylate cyclase [Rhodocyclales bacterium GT-UBC]